MHPGEVVSTDRIVDIVWNGQPPATVVKTLHNGITYLRNVLPGRAAIVASRPGYRLELPGEATDVERAQALIRQPADGADHVRRAAQLRSALSLWRGKSLSDVASVDWLHEQGMRLEQLRMDGTQALVDVRLDLGEHEQLVPELEQLTNEHPYRENLHRQLMLALYRCGRQADALQAYQRLRRSVVDELGIDPSPDLRTLETAILRQDAGLRLPAPAVTVTGRPAADAVPAQLPLAAHTFIGRTAELTQLDAAPAASWALPITVVSGTAGVGKTALAVHWAHRVATHFPDGQLYIDLHGFDPSGVALESAEVVRRFLQALGVAADQIPADADAQAALYRSRLFGKRVLVVLDNARDSAQVGPLLPGAPTCLVVVTSRRPLTALVAAHGAVHVNLDVLGIADARTLLARRIGTDRVATEPDAVDEIIEYCARLPLALAILAARAATSPGTPLHSLAADLRNSRDRLDTLTTDDPNGDVRAVFSRSYRALTAAAARLFRLLGLHPGPDVTGPAAASLAGLTRSAVGSSLAELVQANLVIEYKAGRYKLHDLLRAYATEQAHAYDSPEQRQLAVHRIIDHYLRTTDAATRIRYAHRPGVDLEPAMPGITPETFTGRADALAWLVAEQPTLLAIVDLAAGAGLDTRVATLTRSITTFLHKQEHWHDLIGVQEGALAVAVRLGDRLHQADAHRWMGYADIRLRRLPQAHTQLRHALALFEGAGDIDGQAAVHHNLTMMHSDQGHFAQAVRHAERALALWTSIDNKIGRALALNALGCNHARLGNHRKALTLCSEALALQVKLDDPDWAADTRHSIGYALHCLGHHAEALQYYEQALAQIRDSRRPHTEAEYLITIGDVHQATGDTGQAREAWKQALSILHRLQHPSAATVRDRLSALGTSHQRLTRRTAKIEAAKPEQSECNPPEAPHEYPTAAPGEAA
jgi:DNA-binding SARP family transcriptional activator/predicted negative regulator of RcsB-dependent stress response